MAVSALLYVFGVGAYGPEAAWHITESLRSEGLATRPDLTRAGADGYVDVVATYRRTQPIPDEPRAARESPPAPPPAAQAVAEQTAAQVSSTAVAAGVLVPGGLLTLSGFGAWWLYGLIFMVTTAGVWALVHYRLPWLARIIAFRAVPGTLRGVLLGVVPMLLVGVVVGLTLVGPVYATREAAGREDAATHELTLARQAIEDRDSRTAHRHLDRARGLQEDASGIPEAQDRLRRLDAEDADYRRDRDAYVKASAAFNDRDYEQAILGMSGIADFRDASAQVERYSAEASRTTLATALGRMASDPRRALDLAQTADEFRSTQATRTAIREARRALDVRRRRDLAAERAQAAREANRREERRQRAAERRRQAAENRRVPDLSAGGGSARAPGVSGPSTTNWCGKRDGDGDGIYCEGE